MNPQPVEIVIRLKIELPPGMSLVAASASDEPLTCSVPVAAEKLGIGRSKVAELIARGDLESIKIDGARRIPYAAITAYVQRLAEGGSDAPAA